MTWTTETAAHGARQRTLHSLPSWATTVHMTIWRQSRRAGSVPTLEFRCSRRGCSSIKLMYKQSTLVISAGIYNSPLLSASTSVCRSFQFASLCAVWKLPFDVFDSTPQGSIVHARPIAGSPGIDWVPMPAWFDGIHSAVGWLDGWVVSRCGIWRLQSLAVWSKCFGHNIVGMIWIRS
jgi:hypothetical protein